MDGIVLFALIVAGLAYFGALALTFGVDSRPDFDDERFPGVTLS